MEHASEPFAHTWFMKNRNTNISLRINIWVPDIRDNFELGGPQGIFLWKNQMTFEKSTLIKCVCRSDDEYLKHDSELHSSKLLLSGGFKIYFNGDGAEINAQIHRSLIRVSGENKYSNFVRWPSRSILKKGKDKKIRLSINFPHCSREVKKLMVMTCIRATLASAFCSLLSLFRIPFVDKTFPKLPLRLYHLIIEWTYWPIMFRC